MIEITKAEAGDFETISESDRHISERILKEKLDRGEVLVARLDGKFVGWLRYCLFWDEIPFMNMLYVLDGYRDKGIGRALVSKWECMMLGEGYDKVMTSTLENEEAQFFYRKLGYRDLGKFMPFADEYELIMGKDLVK